MGKGQQYISFSGRKRNNHSTFYQPKTHNSPLYFDADFRSVADSGDFISKESQQNLDLSGNSLFRSVVGIYVFYWHLGPQFQNPDFHTSLFGDSSIGHQEF